LLEERMLTEKTFDTGTVKINYAEGPPNGKPLVLLHGFSTRWQSFLPVLPTLSFRYHTYALDLRGHGRSERTPGDYVFENFVADVVAFIQNVVGEPVFLLGHSLGGDLSLYVAAHVPHLVQAAILGDIGIRSEAGAARSQDHADSFTERMRRTHMVVTMGGSRDEKLAALAEIVSPIDGVGLRGRLSEVSQTDPDLLLEIGKMRSRAPVSHVRYYTEVLPKVKCPILLLQADPECGAVMTDDGVALALSLLADGTHAQLKDCNHDMMWQQPTLFANYVSEFLESV
jgi:pimeloyl-ACP methyl ester carboxylesterase